MMDLYKQGKCEVDLEQRSCFNDSMCSIPIRSLKFCQIRPFSSVEIYSHAATQQMAAALRAYVEYFQHPMALHTMATITSIIPRM